MPPLPLILNEQGIEDTLIAKLSELKYEYRPDIQDRTALEQNFRQKFDALNRVRLTAGEFSHNDGTPLNSTLLKDNANIKKCLFIIDRKDLDRLLLVGMCAVSLDRSFNFAQHLK